MKPLQRSCAKLKLRTGLATRTAYLKLRQQHPASVESYCLRQERVNKRLKHTLEFDSTAAVRPSRGCSHRGAASSGGCEGRAPPGPDPHTTPQKPKKCKFLKMMILVQDLINIYYISSIKISFIKICIFNRATSCANES